MAEQRLGIIMYGVTGRMGLNQHLIRSIVAIRKQGGVQLSNGQRVMPDPILIGRNAERIEALAAHRAFPGNRPSNTRMMLWSQGGIWASC